MVEGDEDEEGEPGVDREEDRDQDQDSVFGSYPYNAHKVTKDVFLECTINRRYGT